jgi:AraC-like DNA-binding protein
VRESWHDRAGAVRYHESAPSPVLRPFVDAIWRLTSDGAIAPAGAGTVIPDGSAEIVLAFADAVRPSPRARAVHRFVAGQMERPWRVGYTGAVDLLGVRLHPAAQRLVLGVRPSSLTNRAVSLKRISPSLDEVLAAIDGGGEPDRRLPSVETALGVLLKGVPPPHPLIAGAASEIRRSGGRVRIAALARGIGCGVRRLERVFLDEVGLSPKRWARVIRFQQAFAATAAADPDWAQVATALGYADQAHLTREFREFAGVPPSHFFKTASRRRR